MASVTPLVWPIGDVTGESAPSPHEGHLLATMHYDLRSLTDLLVVTAAETLANAFFTMFRMNEGARPELDALRGGD